MKRRAIPGLLLTLFAPRSSLAADAPASLPALPLPPMPLSAALRHAAGSGLVPAAPSPMPGGLVLHLAAPAADTCSPRAAWLLCPGLRLAVASAGPEASVQAIWQSWVLSVPQPLAALRAVAIARHGPPVSERREQERRRGRDLDLLVLAWRLAQRAAPLRLELTLVLEEEAGPAPEVVTIGWSAVPEPP